MTCSWPTWDPYDEPRTAKCGRPAVMFYTVPGTDGVERRCAEHTDSLAGLTEVSEEEAALIEVHRS